MSKDPAFLFYPNDYIGGTMGMTFEEKGAYIELLMLQFNRGHMTKDMIGQTVGQLWVKLEDKFAVDKDGKFYNRRLDEEQQKRKAYTTSRRNNLKGNNQYSKTGAHTTERMEDENEIEDISNNKIPEISDFLKYCKKICGEAGKNYEELEFSLKAKYDTWKESGWKDGNKNEIGNWKNKIRNTLPFLKEIKGNNDRYQKVDKKFDDEF